MSAEATDDAPASPAVRKRKRSLWPLWAIFGAAVLTWVGFAYIAARARNRTWALIAAAYFAVTVPVAIFMPEESDMSTSADLYVFGLVLPFWAIGIVHTFMVNRQWHEWREANARPYALPKW